MFRQSRREFLEQSMLAATAALSVGHVGSRVAPAAEGSSEPSEILRVAIVGVRGRGASHIDEFVRRKDCEIVAIVDADETVGNSRCEQIAMKTGKKPTWFKDMRKAYDDKSINIVSIATPNHWHALGAIWAVQAGKDVYVEKPVSHNVSEGRRIVEAAEKHKKIVQTGTQCRSQKGTIDAIEYVKAGKIGDVKLARGLCYKSRGSIGPKGNYDVPANVDYDLWCGPAPMAPLTRKNLHYDWHWVWDTGNGDLGNQGIHQMDIARWGLGVDGLGNSVQSYGGRLGYIDAGETANTQICTFDYGNGKTLVFEVRGLKTASYKGAGVGNVFHGSEGYVVLSGYDRGAAFDPDGKMIQQFQGGGDHFGNFLKAVRSRKPEELNAHIEEGHLSSALCHLGNISYRLGEQLSVKDAEKQLKGGSDAIETFERVATHLKDNGVDLETAKIGFGPTLPLASATETFTGELAAKANPMLTRDYRKPYVVPETKDL